MSVVELPGFDYWTLHGEHVPVTLGKPATGAALTKTVPGSVEWEILSVSFTYTAGAGVADRFPLLQFLDTTATAVAEIGTPYKLVAADASRVTFGVGIVQFGADSAARMGAGIPPLRLGDGMQLKLTATNLDATDAISAARMFVRQWRVRE